MHILSSQTQCRVTAPVQLQEPSSILRLFANTLLVTWHKSPMGRIRSLLTSGNFFPNCSYWIVLFKEDRQQNGQMIFLTHLALPPEPIWSFVDGPQTADVAQSRLMASRPGLSQSHICCLALPCTCLVLSKLLHRAAPQLLICSNEDWG